MFDMEVVHRLGHRIICALMASEFTSGILLAYGLFAKIIKIRRKSLNDVSAKKNHMLAITGGELWHHHDTNNTMAQHMHYLHIESQKILWEEYNLLYIRHKPLVHSIYYVKWEGVQKLFFDCTVTEKSFCTPLILHSKYYERGFMTYI